MKAARTPHLGMPGALTPRVNDVHTTGHYEKNDGWRYEYE